MRSRNEAGIAIVLALFLMSALSVLGASMMFLSQTETYATMNYRMMSQARYAAEAGIQRTSAYLLDSTQYAPPTVPGGATDSITDSYDISVSPVICKVGGTGCTGGAAIVLSSTVADSNYPSAAKKTAFASAAAGSLTAGTATLNYTTTATLLSMQYFEGYAGTSVVQTWKVESTGSVSGTRNATVAVMALLETPKVPAAGYAAFATSDTCGALYFHGNVDVDSYDSTSLSGSTSPTVNTTGGNVGTNGNLMLGGAATVYGDLYTPRQGVGTCNAGSVNAYTGATASLNPYSTSHAPIQLPAVVSYPTPVMPTYLNSPPVTLNSSTFSNACTLLGLTAPQCTITGSTIKLDASTGEIHLPELTVNGNFNLQMVAGTGPNKYDVNGLTLLGNATIQTAATTSSQAAVLNVVGKDQTGADLTNPLNLGGGGQVPVSCGGTCSNYDASLLKIVYAGNGEIDMFGNNETVATVYAPNAYIHLSGTFDLYGAIVGAAIDNAGTPKLHYDRRLSHDIYMPGHPAAGTFTWKRAS